MNYYDILKLIARASDSIDAFLKKAIDLIKKNTDILDCRKE